MIGASRRRSLDTRAVTLGRVGAGLGVLAGALQLTIGPAIRDWVGDKQDTTRLGIATMVLSGIALAAVTVRRRSVEGHRPAVALGLLLPALVCFSTVGRLWLVPGPLLLTAGGMVLLAAGPGELRHAIDRRRWQTGLVVTCGALQLFLGATTLGLAGLLGVSGGLLVWASTAIASRAPRRAVALLAIGVLPFAATTWWSVVTPLLAILTLVLGGIVIGRPGRRRADAAARPGAAVPLPAAGTG